MTNQELYDKRSAYHAAYYLAHKEMRKAQAAERYQRTKAQQNARAKAWQKAHPEQTKAAQQRYRDRNREKLRARDRAYNKRRYTRETYGVLQRNKPAEVAARLVAKADQIVKLGYSGKLVKYA